MAGTLPDTVIAVFVFAFGAVVGSFLNVVIYRVPIDRSIVRPGSACPDCGTPIRWYDNIPVLSWLVLRARCRACTARISVRYPLVEAASGCLAVLAVREFGPQVTVSGVEALVFSWICLVLALIDYDHQLLPDVITLPTLVLGLVASYAGGLAEFVDAVIGAAVGGAIPMAVIIAYKLLRGEEGMGWGDVKYLAAIGAVLGTSGTLWVLVVGSVLGALVGIGLIIAGRGSAKTALPFGTFLSAAALLRLYLPVALPVIG
jgi:leader peptidase (prepilin peptidase)/N-methyltransferase